MNETQGLSPKVCFFRDSYLVNRRAVRFSDRVMPAHSRSKNGVASLAYVAGIRIFVPNKQDVDARDIGERSDAVLRTAMRGHDAVGESHRPPVNKI